MSYQYTQMSSNTEFKGVAVVTGAAQGIGRAIALRLADDGYDIAANDIASNAERLGILEDEIKARGRRTYVKVADVSIENEVKDMIDSVVEALGGLDVFVANAGISIFKSLVNTSVEEWDHLHSVNTRGTFLCYKYAAKQMISQGRGGRIIGASSVSGKRGSAFCTAYCSTKFAVRGLTQAAAIELGPHGITVNAYAPGPVDTDMLRFLDKSSAEVTGGEIGDLYKALDARAPVGYKGKPEDISSLVSYLVSKDAHFITGQSVSCNGGIYFD